MLRKIFKNSSYILISQVFIKGISFFYTIFLARTLGVNNFGIYITAIAYFSLVSSFADFGINRYLIREGSINRKNLGSLLATSTILRLSLTILVLVFFSAWIFLVDEDINRVNLTLLALIAIIPQAISLNFEAALIASEKIKYTAFASVGLSLSTIIIGSIMLFLGFNIYGAILAFVFGQLGYLILLVHFLSTQKIQFFSHFDSKLLKQVIIGSIPYGVLNIVGLISFKTDIILLANFKGNFEVGIYGAAYKFLEAVVFIPTAFAVSIAPVVAKLFAEDILKIKDIYFRGVKIMLILGLFFIIIYQLILPEIIKFFLPEYILSIGAIRILSLAIPFIFAHMIAGQILLSSEKYLKYLILIYFTIMLINIIALVIFIPQYGYIAASWLTVFSSALTLILFTVLLKYRVFKNISRNFKQ